MSAFSTLRARLLAQHIASPQRERLVELALAQIETALVELGRHGHQVHLAEGPGDVDSYPRLVFHASAGIREIFHPSDLLELGPGWYDSWAQAQQAEGMAAQFAGRGGVRRVFLPAVIPSLPSKDELK